MSPRKLPRKILLLVFPVVLTGSLLIAYLAVRRPVAETFFKWGSEAKTSWALDNAIYYFSWSSWIDGRGYEAELARAECLQLRGEFIQSKSAFDSLISKTKKNPDLYIRSLNANGRNLFSLGLPDEAIKYHRESLLLARAAGDRKNEARALVDLARVQYHAKGRFDEARTSLDAALKIGRETADDLIVADALRHIGVVLWWGKGELERPLKEYYEPAIGLYRKHRDLRSEATMLSNISLIHSFRGDGYKFMKLQQESLAIREKIGDLAGLCESYLSIGSAYFNVKNLRQAREYFLRSIALSKRTGFRLTQKEAETSLGGIYIENGNFDEAAALFEDLYKQESGSPEQAISRLGSIGNCYLYMGEFEKAKDVFKRLLKLEMSGESSDPRTLAAVHVVLGEVYLRTGDLDKAEYELAKSVEYGAGHRGAILQGRFTYSITRAEIEYKKGNSKDALAYLSEAADDELNLFASSGTNQINTPMTRDYDRLFSLLLEKLNSSETEAGLDVGEAEALAFRFLEQRRYRAFRNFVVSAGSRNDPANGSEAEKESLALINSLNEQLDQGGGRDIQKRLRSAYNDYENSVVKQRFSEAAQSALAAARPVDLNRARLSLDDKSAMIEYLFVGERTYALVVKRTGLSVFSVPAKRQNVRNKAGLLRSSLISPLKGQDNDDWKPIAKSLREGLLGPVEDSGVLSDIETLVIVRYGELHDLPFALFAVETGAKTSFLVEDYMLVYPPSATFYALERTLPSGSALSAFGRNLTESNEYPALKLAEKEAAAAAEILSGRAFLGDMADESRFKELAPNATVVHISTHAVANGEMPLLSKILLGAGSEDDGNLTMREILELRVDARLVTIAACDGARSFASDPHQLMEIDRAGLAESFLHSGAHNVLASLSPASDEATYSLMKDFYQNLGGSSLARTIAQSQRKMLRGELGENYRHPRYWSNFILIGDGR